MSDKVEIFDFEKYNFVTPIIKPEAMDRAELLDRVMNNYRRFVYEKGALLLSVGRHRTATALSPRMSESVLEIRLREEVLRSRQSRLLGPQSKKNVDFHFDRSRRIEPVQTSDWQANAERSRKAQAQIEPVMACGGGTEQMAELDDLQA